MNNIAVFTKTRLIYLLIIILIIIVVISLSTRKNEPTISNTLTPTPTQIVFSNYTPMPANNISPTQRPGGGPQPGVDYFKIDEESLKRNQVLGDLLSKLPYSGQNFTFDFSYSEFTYKLTIADNNREAGEKEFDEFLKNNKVESRTWIEDLVIEYK